MKSYGKCQPNFLAYGGYGHNYPYLGYYDGYSAPYGRQKLTAITKPTETVFNSDTLDPLPSDAGTAHIETFGYSYAPSYTSYIGNHTYVRHGNGVNYYEIIPNRSYPVGCDINVCRRDFSRVGSAE